MRILTIRTDSPLANLSYVILDENGEAFIVDPWDGEDCKRQVMAAGGRVKGILNTHEHGDHTRGNAWLQKNEGVAVWGHKNHPGVTRPLKDRETIRLSSRHSLEAWTTPGHTFAHQCFIVKEGGDPIALLSGDTLFPAGVGNCRGGGDPRALYESVTSQLRPLKDQVKLLSGHDYLANNLRFARSLLPQDEVLARWSEKTDDAERARELLLTTMGDERRINVFLRLDDPTLRKALAHDGEAPLATEEDVFLALRRRRDAW